MDFQAQGEEVMPDVIHILWLVEKSSNFPKVKQLENIESRVYSFIAQG